MIRRQSDVVPADNRNNEFIYYKSILVAPVGLELLDATVFRLENL